MIDLSSMAFRERLRDDIDARSIGQELVAASRERVNAPFAVLWTDLLSITASGGNLPAFPHDDPIIGYALRHPTPAFIDDIAVESPALRALRERGASVVAPLVSLGMLVVL